MTSTRTWKDSVPNMKYQVSEWKQHHTRVIKSAGQNRVKSARVRTKASEITKEKSNELQRTHREVENRLTLRIDDVANRESDLDKAIEQVFKEVGNMQAKLDQVRSIHREKDLPLEITRCCMDWRRERVSIDLVDDEVDDELDKEEQLFSHVQGVLANLEEDCKEQLRLLRAAHYQLESDKTDKFTAKSLDLECASLELTSRSLSRYMDATARNPKSVEPDEWDGYTSDNIRKARQEIYEAELLREQIDKFIRQSSDDIASQTNRTDDAFNQRISDITLARQQDQQDLDKVREEISEQEKSIEEVQKTIDDKDAPLKMAETRLARRQARPNIELVHDPVEDMLVKEVMDLENAIEDFKILRSESENAHRGLVRAENDLIEDIKVKSQSLSIDNRCMQRRQQFKYRTDM
eukprot:m.64859 g.64859  ORF g.64859 m.64859 type:complete len:408 (+) comp11681_c0_seq1:295-1518(+)